MARSADGKASDAKPTGGMKSPQAQVDEIRKLVADAQERLDQVSRALNSLGERVGEDRVSERD